MNSVILTAPSKLEGTIFVPGSKSETNRYLLLAAQHKQPFRITGASTAEDSRILVQAFSSLGFEIEEKEQEIAFSGKFHAPGSEIIPVWVGSGGTTLRFLVAFLATQDGIFEVSGTDQLAVRPLKPLIACLQNAGVRIEYKEGTFPVRIYGNSQWKPSQLTIEMTESSQFLSALLLLAPSFNTGTEIHFNTTTNDSEFQLSGSYIELTLQCLQELGMEWSRIPKGLKLELNQYQTSEVHIGGDWSSASYLLGAACLLPCRIILQNLDLRSWQGDVEQLDLFLDWGGIIMSETSEGLLIENETGTKVKAFHQDFSWTPDLVQTFAVLATYAEEQSSITGIQSLKHKETDRIQAIINELNKTGAMVWLENEELIILPGMEMNTPDSFKTYQDHRMAMSLALLSAGRPMVRIENPSVVIKSYPEFWDHLQAIGFKVQFRAGGALPPR